MFFSGTGKEEQEEGDEAVEEENLETKGVSEPRGGVEFQHIAYHRRQHGDKGHPAVVDITLGKEAEGVEAQQRSIGKARNIEDDIDERLVVEWSESNDNQQV